MAESQAPFSYNNQSVNELVQQLSSSRYSTYLKKAGHDHAYAFQLYLYNARLAKAFLFPLHVVEIVLRNAVDQVLSAMHGAQWPGDATFQALLTPESLTSLQKAIQRANHQGPAAKDDVIAHLTFDFWSNLFRPAYDRSIWQTSMPMLLPESPATTRAAFQPLVARINHFRNRIAHHEPIFSEDATLKFKDILDTVGYRSQAAASWLRSHATVHRIIRTRPNGAGVVGPLLGDRSDANFVLVSVEEPLSNCVALFQQGFVVCQEVDLSINAVLDASDVGRFAMAQMDDTGLVALNEFRISDVIAWSGASTAFVTHDEDQALSELEASLKKNRFAIVRKQGDGAVQGVIAKAHRRY